MSSSAGLVIPTDLDSALVRLRDSVAAERALEVGGMSDSGPDTEAALPFVSVVVLNFNGSEVLGRCLDSLLAQDYPDYPLG